MTENEGEIEEKMKIAEEYFNCSNRERISFELGIKLGALFHQFIGTPVSPHNIRELEEAMESTAESQAFVEAAEVDIVPEVKEENKEDESDGPFDYTTLSGDMLVAEIIVRYEGLRALGKMKFIDEMEYPLMYIESIEKIG